MGLVYLIAAILCEVGATLTLRVATRGRRVYYAVVAFGYLLSFGALSLALDAGFGIGAAYGIWAATGVALTALASRVLFHEPLTILMIAGIALIIGGVILIESGVA